MKNITEKQILEWKEELAKQVKTRDQAQKVFWNEENKKRIISAVKAPVSRSDEKFIAKFFDKQLVKAMKESSGKTEIIIG